MARRASCWAVPHDHEGPAEKARAEAARLEAEAEAAGKAKADADAKAEAEDKADDDRLAAILLARDRRGATAPCGGRSMIFDSRFVDVMLFVIAASMYT